ncbi:hypothetical protein BGX30_012082, partial [Mortierella sp. GBA39]
IREHGSFAGSMEVLQEASNEMSAGELVWSYWELRPFRGLPDSGDYRNSRGSRQNKSGWAQANAVPIDEVFFIFRLGRSKIAVFEQSDPLEASSLLDIEGW